MSTLIGVTLAVISIFVVTGTVWGQVINPLLFSETKSASYQKFLELSLKIGDLENSEVVFGKDSLLLELEQGYSILGFADSSSARTCVFQETVLVQKPASCSGGSCLCLFKGDPENDKPLVCKAHNLDIFTWRRPTRPITEYSSCIDGISSFVGDREYIQFSAMSGDKIFSEKIMLFKHPDGVFVLAENDVNREYYKKSSVCPDSSYSRCVSKHYDYVFSELKVDLGRQESYVCKFDLEDNACNKREVVECGNKMIHSECYCGDTAYESGYCINDEYTPYALPRLSDYCFSALENGIVTCEDYGEGDFDVDQQELICSFNLCQLTTKCYWNDGCSDCPPDLGCPTNLYFTGSASRALNSCGCRTFTCQYAETSESCETYAGCEWIAGECQETPVCGIGPTEDLSRSQCCGFSSGGAYSEFEYAIIPVNRDCQDVCGSGWTTLDREECEQGLGY